MLGYWRYVISILVLAVGTGSLAQAASSSWVTQVPGLTVAMSDRASRSDTARPPAGVAAPTAVIERVQWQYQHPPGAALQSWLCHPERCVPLSGMRGETRALSGLGATTPLHFQFALRPGQRPVSIKGLQMIINYQ
ncbi:MULTISPECIES: flagellar protein FlhE [unclassified Halomonas]|uniref:flagellar protein FlhE n=1 Tax=unclassified Halomonas TaxID=2609666 RepID=UPI0006DB62AB|nr:MULTISPECIES: flagellar protein FlhE [unclassified Halomonas]KPQ18789.1 MAG: flagellar protein FlhE [Halomonas sp. HL-93]SBR52300.1 flagellar protein FlhE [Halomonas sp. HL-93]SNY98077.1 flagellar protein FlhE [Halomonas sp. hl-4]